MRRTKLATVLALATALAGCKVGPNYRPPPLLDGRTLAPVLTGANEPAFQAAPLPPHWWRLYDDARLDALEQKALIHNTNLRTALASLEQVRDVLRQSEAQRLPQTALNGSATYGQGSADAVGAPAALSPGPVYNLAGLVSYDLDLFGRLKRAVEAGRADVGAAEAALDLARVNVAAQTAAAYAGACSGGLQIAVTLRSIRLAEATLNVVQRRYTGGVSGVTDVVRARTLLRQTMAGLPTLQAQQRSDLYMLAVLTGDPPGAFPRDVAGCTAPRSCAAQSPSATVRCC